MFNRICMVLLTVSRTSPFKIFFFCLSLSQSSHVSRVDLTDRGEGGVWSQIIHCQESMGFYKLFIVQSTLSKSICKYEKMCKNCIHHHVVNISVWAVFGAANTAAPLYTPVLTIISILTICLHQFIGAASTVTPIYLCDWHSSTDLLCNCARSTNRRWTLTSCEFLRFRGFF